MSNLTSDQRQVIFGTLLGNGFIESPEGFYLVMKSRSAEWLSSKAKVLANFEQAVWTSRGNFYWRSKADPIFEEFDNLCYDGHKKVARMECLDMLKNVGVMTWYGDSGCLVGRDRRNASLRTQALGLSAETAARYFNEVQVPCRINQVRQRPVLAFSLKGTERLMKIIGSVLPKNRYHLVPGYLRLDRHDFQCISE